MSLTHLVLASFLSGVCAGGGGVGGDSFSYIVLALFLCGEFLLHIACCLDFYAGSFSYISRGGLYIYIYFNIFYLGSLTPPCCLDFYAGNFSYTSHAGFIFMWGVSLTHPVLD